MSASPTEPRKAKDKAIVVIAARQHGLLTRVQLLGAGLSDGMVKRRLKAGQLRAVHRGVYLLGPLFPPQARLLSAVLACGDGAVVSHRSAARLWELLGGREATVDVTIPRADHRRPGIRVHRVVAIASDEVTRRERIPVTTAARTLVDIARATPLRDLERALEEALAKRLTSRAELLRLLQRHRRRAGVRRLRALLDAAKPALTRSDAERRFLALVRKARLPEPAVNVKVAGHEVDFLWRSERFIAEIDGFAFHTGAKKFEEDRRRDTELAAAGLRVIRITWRQLTEESEAVLVRLAQALARTMQP